MGGRHEYALVREGACLQGWRLDRLLPGPRPADDRRVGKVGRQSPGGQAPVCHQTAPAEVTSEGLPQPRRRWPCCPQGRGRAAGRGPGRGCVVPSPCSISRACPRLRACPRVGGGPPGPLRTCPEGRHEPQSPRGHVWYLGTARRALTLPLAPSPRGQWASSMGPPPPAHARRPASTHGVKAAAGFMPVRACGLQSRLH